VNGLPIVQFAEPKTREEIQALRTARDLAKLTQTAPKPTPTTTLVATAPTPEQKQIAEVDEATAIFLSIERGTHAPLYQTPDVIVGKKVVTQAPVQKPSKPPAYISFSRPSKGFVQEYLETEVFPKEQLAEEKTLFKEPWEAQVKAAEQQAREEFEARISAMKTEAKKGQITYPTMTLMERGAQIQRGEPISEKDLAAWEAEQRTAFETQISEWKTTQLKNYNLQVAQWRKEWKPKGIAERMMDWKVQTTPLDWMKGVTTPTKAPLAPVAGIVASGESLVYGVAGLAGVETPRPPPTLVSALISKGVGAVTGKPSTELETMYEQYGKEYVGGTLVGDVILAIGLGIAAEKVVSPVISAVKGAWKGSRPDIWLAKHSSWYYSKTGGLAQQVIGSKGVIEPFSLQAAKAGEMAWLLETTPKTSALTVTAAEYAVHKAKVLPHLISRGGLISIGYLRELGFEKPKIMGGLPARQVSLETVLKTAPKTVPYVPSVFGAAPFIVSASTLSLLLGTAATIGAKIVPSTVKPRPITPVHPILTKPKPTRFEKVAPYVPEVLAPLHKKPEKRKVVPHLKLTDRAKLIKKPKPIGKVLPWIGESPILAQPTEEKGVQVSATKTSLVQAMETTQLLTQVLSPSSPFFEPSTTFRVPVKPPTGKGRRKLRKKRRKKVKGSKIGIFKKVHPVASAKSAASYILGGMNGEKKKRKM